ncbi:MAG: endonuclease MutS2 [Anaerolineales bacterium]
MDDKTLNMLEYHKILARLAVFCDFSASKELAGQLRPTADFETAQRLLAETTEARSLLSSRDLTVGGAHDIRPAADLAARGGVLEPQALLDIKSTLIACREWKKTLLGKAESKPNPPIPKALSRRERLKQAQEEADFAAHPFPHLAEIARGLPDTYGLVDAISRVLSEHGEVLDSASPKLASLRGEIKVAHDRLMSRLQRYLTESANKLQEPIITQRDGRYVIPLRAEFKGQIKAIIHDQSASGATLFIEPLPVVELNNALRELELAERNEVRRVLAELSAQVGGHAQELIYGVENLAMLDLTFAKAKYAEELHASEPILHALKVTGSLKGRKAQPSDLTIPTLKLLHARHPLLDPAAVVPIDIYLPPAVRALVITGPNTGGKTVSLKTVGLLALMAQSGLHIPVQSGSELPCFEAIWADIGDEQSIEQSLSTFSGHLTNIVRILKKADSRSLVILDELGAGTDPQEGAALARAILDHLLERSITTFIATHYPELKTYAHATEGVVNASLEFDIATLRPTYKLTIGLPGRSNALAIATRLGLDPKIVSAARNDIHPDNLRADKLLDDIRKERNRASREHEKAEKARKRLEALERELEKRLATIEEERRQVLARARAEAELEIAILKRNLEALKRQLKQARQPLERLKAVEEEIEALEEKVEAPLERRPSSADSEQGTASSEQSAIGLGERVIVSTLNAEGTVTGLGESDAEVQVGSLRIRAKLSDLMRKPQAQESEKHPETTGVERSTLSVSSSPGLELDLRGQASDDALDLLDRYLDQAISTGLPWVRIIHGKGSGTLRRVVRQALRQHPHVISFEEGGPKEGGEGVTVVRLNE